MLIDDCFKELRESSSTLTWSRGVQLTRNSDFFEESKSTEEIVYRVKAPGRQISFRVTLWPEDTDWECDCSEKEDPCHHVVGLAIYIKNDGPGSNRQKNDSATIHYAFEEQNGEMTLRRYIKKNHEESPLKRSLIDLVGGIDSGRIDHPPVAVTQTDYSVDEILQPSGRIADPEKQIPLIGKLPAVHFKGEVIHIDRGGIEPRVHIVEENRGFRIKVKQSEEVRQLFKNMVVLTKNNRITFLKKLKLTARESALVAGNGSYFDLRDAPAVVSEVIPLFGPKVQFDIETDKLPRQKKETPYIILKTKIVDRGEKLEILPKLLYGRPPIAEVEGGELVMLQSEIIPARERTLETGLIIKLQQELCLQPGQRVNLKKEVVFKRVETLKHWEISGSPLDTFMPRKNLKPRISDRGDREWTIMFESSGGPGPGSSTGNSGAKSVNTQSVLSAWENGENYVQLIEGGWAALPCEWLEKYAPRLQRLIDLKTSGKKQASNIELSNICEESDIPRPPSLEKLKDSFNEYGRMCQYPLPKGLRANLREYQKTGYNWLQFMREAEMGALLADDMGLGKTLQALSVLEGRSLVVAPTTVIYTWQEEIEKFRPDLKINLYYGKNRKVPDAPGVTITSYAILRIDMEKLNSFCWDVAVLDEAQIIKNSNSQIARSAFKIESRFRIALSGTPIENRLEDLWSQFHFLNPGFLGSLPDFMEEYARPINRGDESVRSELQRRVRPFILRRLKHEVEKELPPKTEVILYCHLDSEERELYDSLMATTQKEVIEKLQKGGSVFGVLEILLRLRQSCCHSALIPGETRSSSSKIATLVGHLVLAKESGHRALVFSQWTGFLDLLEPALKSSDLKFLRIDGQTKNRRDVIDRFQKKNEADLMIISLKAGGVGMTLTAADQVYIMDPWWNPAVEEQAADRTHRIGQKNPVFVHRIVAKDTIEERILVLQKKKRNLADAILRGTGESHNLTREDIVELLQ